MMQYPASGDLGRAFRASTESAAYQQFLMREREQERLRKDRIDELRGDEAELSSFADAIVSASEIAEFEVDLDRYDTATVAALQENEVQLAQVRERMDALLGQAYVLPDGRRVFKTEDGLRVFDESGKELDASTIDPQEIDDARPRWEQYKPTLDDFKDLTTERTKLLDYQAKLDDARERLDAGDLTRKEFDDLRHDLKGNMPDAVRAELPDPAEDAAIDHENTAQAETLDLSDDMVPASLAPRTVAPGLGG